MEHSAILLTFIKLPIVIKIFVLSIFEWPFYTGFTVLNLHGTREGDQTAPRGAFRLGTLCFHSLQAIDLTIHFIIMEHWQTVQN